MEARYVADRLSTNQIGALLGCSGKTVGLALRAHGTPRRGGVAHGVAERLADRDWLLERYVTEVAKVHDLAAELHCDYRRVTAALRDHGIPIRSRHPPVPAELADEHWLRSAYPARTRKEIAAELGVAKSIVDEALGRYGIRRWPLSGGPS